MSQDPLTPTGGPVSRRGFLKAALAAGAAPWIIPSSALGKDGAVAPSNRITVASIGVNGQGSGDTRAFLALPDAVVLAVCDVDSGHLQKAKAMVEEYYRTERPNVGYSTCAAYRDFREIIDRPDIDAVMIATPDHWHALITIAAARAGKDIYCEKPLANTIAEGRAVCDAIKRSGRVLQTGSHERSRANARFACELVRNGRIGKLHTIRVNLPIDNHEPIPPQPAMPIPPELDYDMWLGPAPWAPYTEKRCHFYFRYITDYSLGELSDRGAHILDLAQLGNASDDTGPVEVSGSGEAPREGLFDTFMKYNFEFVYANGVRIIGQSAGVRGIRYEGSDGWVFVHIHGGNLEADPPSLLREMIYPNELHLGRSPGHHRDFLNAVKSRGSVVAPPEVGHRTASLCHLANIALRLGRKLRWDPTGEVFIGDLEANALRARPARGPWRI